MASNIDEFNEKFVYTKTNPENIIAGIKDSLFFRYNNTFYYNEEGVLDASWEVLPYRTVIIPFPPLTKEIIYEYPYELWIKTTDGYIDQYGDLLPKTGWKFLGNINVFLDANPRSLRWIFPPPVSSTDPIGTDRSRSYDENFFYVKLGAFWHRTPIALFISPSDEGPDRPDLSANLPFVDAPRRLPVPSNPESDLSTVEVGDQTYDKDFFYIRVSKWKRSNLTTYYNNNKMTRF
jgi:hypothetical protein